MIIQRHVCWTKTTKFSLKVNTVELKRAIHLHNRRWLSLRIEVTPWCVASKLDTGCTCTVIFISRPQLLHITTVGFHKAKARMNPPASSHRKQKAFGEGGNPQACSDGSECNVQQFIFIYIYLYHIYKNTSETQTNARHLILHNYRTKTDQPFFLFNKKNYFALFSVKVQLN